MKVSKLQKILKRFHGNKRVYVYVDGQRKIKGSYRFEDIREPVECDAVLEGDKLVLSPRLPAWADCGKLIPIKEPTNEDQNL